MRVKKTVVIVGIVAAAAVTASAAFASVSLKTFGTGAVTVDKKAGTVTIVNGSGEYGGVYHGASGQTRLSKVKLSFTSNGDVGGGAPRWSIPINTDGDRAAEGYAFMDAANCGAEVGDNTAKIATLVDTQNADCKVFFGPAYPILAAFAPPADVAAGSSFGCIMRTRRGATRSRTSRSSSCRKMWQGVIVRTPSATSRNQESPVSAGLSSTRR